MNREDIRKILGESATEEQVTNLLNMFHGAEKTKNEALTSLKNQVSKLEEINSKYNELQTQMDEINKSKMTEQEKLEAREKAVAEKEAKTNIMYNSAKVKEILAGEEISDELFSTLVTSDEATSIANATALKQTLTSLKENVAKQTKESLTNVDLKPSMSNVNPNEDVMNFEKFSKLSAEEQNKFVEEHPEEFEKM